MTGDPQMQSNISQTEFSVLQMAFSFLQMENYIFTNTQYIYKSTSICNKQNISYKSEICICGYQNTLVVVVQIILKPPRLYWTVLLQSSRYDNYSKKIKY